jgi:hypothetical protein
MSAVKREGAELFLLLRIGKKDTDEVGVEVVGCRHPVLRPEKEEAWIRGKVVFVGREWEEGFEAATRCSQTASSLIFAEEGAGEEVSGK